MKNLIMILYLLLLLFSMKALAEPPEDPTDLVAPIPICEGTSATISVIHTGGADGFYWEATGPSWSFSSSTTSSTFNVLTAGPESGTISVWAFNADGNSGTFTKVFEQLGEISAIYGPGGFHCTGESRTYTIDPVVMADYYTWSISGSGWSCSYTSSTWTEVTAGTGNAELSVYASNVCGSNTAFSTTIIPSPPPIEILATDPGPHCPGTSNTYSIVPVSGAISYSWYLESDDPGWSATSSTTTDFIVSSGTMTTGPASIYVAANNICGSSATISKLLAPFAAPIDIIESPPGGHCVNSTKTYSIEPVEHALYYGWEFISNEEWSASSSSTTAIEVTSGTMTTTSATLSVWAVNDCGNSATYTEIIDPMESPPPPAEINFPLMHCSGTTVTYSVEPVSEATYYIWNVNNPTWSVVGTNSVVDVTAGTGSTTLTISSANDCGISSPLSATITPWLSPSTPTITTPDAHCENTTATYTVNDDMYASDYTWYVDGIGWSGSSTISEIGVTSGTTSGTISVVANGYCGSSSTTKIVITPAYIPAKPDKIYTPPNHCEGEIETYACTPVPGATYYSWHISGTGWSGTSNTNYIDLQAGSITALLTVTANSPCGASDTTSIYVTPRTKPNPPNGLSLPNVHCEGTVRTYSVTEVGGAMDYLWSIRNVDDPDILWSLAGLSGSTMDITAGSHSATLTVVAVNVCGESNPYSIVLIPNKIPSIPGYITEPENHCEGYEEVYSIEPIPGAKYYEWGVSGSGWMTSPSTTNQCVILAGSSPGIISVKGINDCGTGVVRTLTVHPDTLPGQPEVIHAPDIHCIGYTEEYSIDPIPEATSYAWTVTGTGWSGSSTSPTINITAGSGEATITARVVNTCGQGPVQTINVTSTTLPSSEFSIDRDTICRDETVTVTYTGDASSDAVYEWDFDEGDATPGVGQGPHSVMWFDHPGNRTITLKVTENTCTSQERLVSVFVENCLGINDNNKYGIKVELLPNPTNAVVTLKLINSPINSGEFRIINNLGQEVYTESLLNISCIYTKDIDLSRFESGSYYVKIILNDIEIVKRLMIIK